MSSLYSQILRQHIWKERILLVFTPDMQNEYFKQQLVNLQAVEGDPIQERRILIYLVSPSQSIQPSGEVMPSSQSQHLYRQYGVSEDEFKVLLIGLDGQLKLRKQKPIPSEDLFNTIDQMPMRRAELRGNG